MLFPRILTGLWALPTIRSGTNGLLKPRLNLTRKDFVEFLPNALSPGARFITIDGAIGGARALRTRGLASRARQLLEMYKKLSKAKLSGFVVATACTGYVLGSGERVDWAGLGWTALGTMGAAACANALNQIIEVGNDRLMGRTATRPLPSGRVTRGHALCFAAVTGVAGVGILAWKANLLTASLGASNIALYAGVYTTMKRFTPWNTWVGAIVGAVPPLLGWSAAAGTLDIASGVLAAMLYFWQIPHFLALAWLCKEDYIRAGFHMLSRYDPTGRRLALCALRNSLYIFPLGIIATWVGLTSQPFAYEAAACSVGMGVTAAAFSQQPSKILARTMFKSSLIFLPLFLLGIMVHRKVDHQGVDWRVLTHKASGGLYPLPASTQVNEPQQKCVREFSLRSVQAAPFPFSPVPFIRDTSEYWDPNSDSDHDDGKNGRHRT